jgi:hypothetical protein
VTLYRLRRRILCTDSVVVLTRGNPVGTAGLTNYMSPGRGSYTGICLSNGSGLPVIGQMLYTRGDRSAHVAYLLPGDDLDQPGLPALLENLAVQAGTWGAHHLLIEIEESSPGLELIRRSGFNVFARQIIWKFTTPPDRETALTWQPATPSGDNEARSLFQQLVPPLVQSAEPFGLGGQRLLFRQDDEILAYAEITSGTHGIYVQPVIHPGAKDIEGLVTGLLRRLPPTNWRPVYLAVRSYQAWLELPLTNLNGLTSPRQALLVKHLAVLQRAGQLVRQPAREVFKPDASIPVPQHTSTQRR